MLLFIRSQIESFSNGEDYSLSLAKIRKLAPVELAISHQVYSSTVLLLKQKLEV